MMAGAVARGETDFAGFNNARFPDAGDAGKHIAGVSDQNLAAISNVKERGGP